jgi:hypothetical protein
MTLPALIFGIILAALYGSAFHFWKADGLPRLALYIGISELGFWVGHLLAALLKWHFIAVGPLNAGMATLGSVLFLFVGRWLSQVEVSQK